MQRIYTRALLRNYALATQRLPIRHFGLIKYKFHDEQWQPNRFEMSEITHKTNAEELINKMPIIEVDGDVSRCTGVHGMNLGHPVQYIQLDRRHEFTPAVCKWCGLRYRRKAHHD